MTCSDINFFDIINNDTDGMTILIQKFRLGLRFPLKARTACNLTKHLIFTPDFISAFWCRGV